MTNRALRLQRAALIGLWALIDVACAPSKGSEGHEPLAETHSASTADAEAPVIEPLELPSQNVSYGEQVPDEVGAVYEPTSWWAYSTAAIFDSNKVQCNGATCALQTTPHLTGGVVGHGALPLCEDEPFIGQPSGATCTAFLVGPDLVATAGHCLANQTACSQRRFVFGFHAQDAEGTQVPASVPASDVYECSELIVRVHEGTHKRDKDFALVRLDRTVRGRTPLALRTSGTVPTGTPLVSIGAMLGLPLKVANGIVTSQDYGEDTRFGADLSMAQGASGAPVISFYLQQVEGILVSGPGPDHVLGTNPDGSLCARSKPCALGSGCEGPGPAWIGIQRIDEIVAALEGRSCYDKVQNGQETDIDCGGPDCRGCLIGKSCGSADDCYQPDTCEVYECIAGQCTSNLSACECTNHSDCEDSLECTVAYCNRVTYQCQNITYACECSYDWDCDDEDPCTNDSCDPSSYTCKHEPEPGCTSCTKDLDCRHPQLQSCVAATCGADQRCSYDDSSCECSNSAECDDGDPCTRDLCFANTRACIHINECD